MYRIIISKIAKKHLEQLKKSEPQSYKKAKKLLLELHEHPRTGTGKPKELTDDLQGFWGRRISQKQRLVYEIKDEVVEVFVLSARGHYGDK